MMHDFRDRVVVVIGAGSGIGRSLALAFVRYGARVHIADIDPARAEAVAVESRAIGGTATAHVVDCSDPARVEALANDVFSADGGVDVLCNVAGVVGGGPMESVTLDDWRWVLGVNLWGVIHGVQAFVPRMIAAGRGGHVVNFASMAGLVGMPMIAPYSASKFAVVGLSESLAPELAAHGIHVTCVCPGMVRTAVIRDARLSLPGDWADRIGRFFNRYGADPERVAQRVLRAVRLRKGLLVTAGGWMRPLWLVKRISTPLYHGLMRTFTIIALRRVPQKRGHV